MSLDGSLVSCTFAGATNVTIGAWIACGALLTWLLLRQCLNVFTFPSTLSAISWPIKKSRALQYCKRQFLLLRSVYWRCALPSTLSITSWPLFFWSRLELLPNSVQQLLKQLSCYIFSWLVLSAWALLPSFDFRVLIWLFWGMARTLLLLLSYLMVLLKFTGTWIASWLTASAVSVPLGSSSLHSSVSQLLPTETTTTSSSTTRTVSVSTSLPGLLSVKTVTTEWSLAEEMTQATEESGIFSASTNGADVVDIAIEATDATSFLSILASTRTRTEVLFLDAISIKHSTFCTISNIQDEPTSRGMPLATESTKELPTILDAISLTPITASRAGSMRDTLGWGSTTLSTSHTVPSMQSQSHDGPTSVDILIATEELTKPTTIAAIGGPQLATDISTAKVDTQPRVDLVLDSITTEDTVPLSSRISCKPHTQSRGRSKWMNRDRLMQLQAMVGSTAAQLRSLDRPEFSSLQQPTVDFATSCTTYISHLLAKRPTTPQDSCKSHAQTLSDSLRLGIGLLAFPTASEECGHFDFGAMIAENHLPTEHRQEEQAMREAFIKVEAIREILRFCKRVE